MTFSLALWLLSVPAAPAGAQADPFADVSVAAAPAAAAPDAGFFSENFGFRRELMSEFGFSDHDPAASRQSAGFEVLKKFSTETKTWAAVDFQGRVVRRDRYVGSANDMEGMDRPGWSLEYHNVYADLYSVTGEVGRVNLRAGRFYVPFGLNLRTDTHGSVLQLSNEQDFGFERDWYAGLWGALDERLNYDAYYLTGSGYDLKFKGQSGLGAARLSLSDRYASRYGLEGGVSFIAGQRLVQGEGVVDTTRGGMDARYRRAVPSGSAAWTTEFSGGRDGPENIFMQLHQLDYLRASRRWGLSAQYRRYEQARAADASLFVEAAWYFRNDVGNADLHSIRLNLETQTERRLGPRAEILTLQYYRYW